MAWDFDGVDDRITGTLTTAVDGSAGWHFGAWLKLDNAGQSSNGRLLYMGADGGGDPSVAALHVITQASGLFEVRQHSINNSVRAEIVTSSTVWTAGTWVCVFITFDSSDRTLTLWFGTESGAMAEAAYSTDTVMSAGPTPEYSSRLFVGDRAVADRAIDGRTFAMFLAPGVGTATNAEEYRTNNSTFVGGLVSGARVFARLDSASLVDSGPAAITLTAVGNVAYADDTPTPWLASSAVATATHSLDGVLRATTTATHSLDGVLRATTTATHSLDGVLRATTTAAHSLDGVLRATTTATHSLDGVLRATTTAAHSLDATLFVTNTRLHSTNAILVSQLTRSHNLDVLFKGTYQHVYQVDSLLVNRLTSTHSTNAVLSGLFTRTHAVNASLKGTPVLTYGLDTVLMGRNTLSHAVDASLKGSVIKSHAVDAVVTVPTFDFGNAVAFDTGGFSVQFNHSLAGDWSIGLWARRADLVVDVTRVLLIHMRDTGGNTRGYVSMNASGFFEVQHYNDPDSTASYTLVSTPFPEDAWVFIHINFIDATGLIDVYFGTEANEAVECSYTTQLADGTGWSGGIGSALYILGRAANFTAQWAAADGDGVDRLYVLDSALSGSDIELSRQATLDLGLGRALLVLVECNSTPPVDTGEQSGTNIITTDAVLVLVDGPQLVSGAPTTYTRSHTTNAVLRATSTRAHGIDAICNNTFAISHSFDAIINFYGLLAHTVNAVLRARITNAHGLDAHTVKKVTATHSVDTLLVNRLTLAHSTDAVLVVGVIPVTADYYANATVTSGGSGTLGNPWNVAYLASGAGGTVIAGDVLAFTGLYVDEGVNADGRPSVDFTVSNCVIVAYNGGFTIQPRWHGNRAPGHSPGACFQISGSDNQILSTWANPIRCTTSIVGTERQDIGRNGFDDRGARNTVVGVFIDNVDAGLTSFDAAIGAQYHQLVIRNTGIDEASFSLSNHAIYAHGHVTSTKRFVSCLVTNPGKGYHFHWYGEGGGVSLANLEVRNSFFGTNGQGEIFLMGGAPATPIVDAAVLNRLWTYNCNVAFGTSYQTVGNNGSGSILNSFLYCRNATSSAGFQPRLVDIAENWASITARDNTMVNVADAPETRERMVLVRHSRPTSNTWSGNRYHGLNSGSTFQTIEPTDTDLAGWKTWISSDTDATMVNTLPAKTTYVGTDLYGIGWVPLFIFDPGATTTTSVNPSSFLSVNDQYRVYALQDVHGPSLASGTYAGGDITIPVNHGRHDTAVGVVHITSAVAFPAIYQPLLLVRITASTPTTRTVSHTTDAVLRARYTRTHTVSAVAVARLTRSHSVQSVLLATATRTHTVSAIAVARLTKVHTTDAVLRTTYTRTHTVGAILRATYTRSHVAEAVLRSRSTIGHGVDASVQAGRTRSHGLDAVLRLTRALVHSVDAHSVLRLSRSHGVDAVLRGTTTTAHGLNTLVVTRLALSHGIDARLLLRSTITHDVSSVLRATYIRSHGTDFRLIGTLTRSHSAGAVLRATSTSAHGVDAVTRDQSTVAHTLSVVLKSVSGRSHGINAMLSMGSVKTHGVDTILRVRLVTSHGADAIIVQRLTKTLVLDALVMLKSTRAHGADARLLLRSTLSHGVSASIVGTRSVDHAMNAVLRATSTRANVVTATLMATTMVTHGLGFVLLLRSTAAHGVGAVTMGTTTRSHTATALLLGTTARSHGLSAVLVTRSTRSHTTDAVLARRGAGVAAKIVGPFRRTIAVGAFRRTFAHLEDSVNASNTFSTLSLERVWCRVQPSSEFGVLVDPTSGAVSMAVVPRATQPGSLDWADADWTTQGSGTTLRFLASAQIGSGSDLGARAAGTYEVWVRYTLLGDTVTEEVGRIRLE